LDDSIYQIDSKARKTPVITVNETKSTAN